MNFKVSGVYDLHTVQNLISLGIKSFVFDLRPKSVNFIQINNIAEILNSLSLSSLDISLHFEDEKDFVIEHTIQTLNKKLSDNRPPEFKLNLFVSGVHPLSFYEKFKHCYCWKYSELVDLTDLKEMKYLKAVSFDYEYLERLMNFGQLFDFMTDFRNQCSEDVYFQFETDWQACQMDTITDFLDFNFIQYKISNYMENSFRSINLIKLNKFFLTF